MKTLGYNMATKILKNPNIEVNNRMITSKYELKVRIFAGDQGLRVEWE